MLNLNTEKLEPRQMAAADLAAALEVSDIQSSATSSETASVGKFCRVAEIKVSTDLATPAIYEKTSPNTQTLDVNHDGFISPIDADAILASMNVDQSVGPRQNLEDEVDGEGEEDNSPAQNYDVNSDGHITAADVLAVINRVHFYNSLVPCNCTSCLASAVTEGV